MSEFSPDPIPVPFVIKPSVTLPIHDPKTMVPSTDELIDRMAEAELTAWDGFQNTVLAVAAGILLGGVAGFLSGRRASPYLQAGAMRCDAAESGGSLALRCRPWTKAGGIIGQTNGVEAVIGLFPNGKPERVP